MVFSLSKKGELGAWSRALSKSSLDAHLKSERIEPCKTTPPKDSGVAHDTPLLTVILIENRRFVRDCIAQTLKLCSKFNVVSFSSVAKWIEAGDAVAASLILLCISGQNDPEVQREITLLAQGQKAVPIIPVVLVSDEEDVDHIIYALNQGARGYIPTSVSLEVAIEAMHLVNAGGTYVPASSLVAAHQSSQEPRAPKRLGIFTARQAAVVEALRKGKANKIIAMNSICARAQLKSMCEAL